MADHQEDNDPFEEDIVFDEAGLLGGKMPRARQQATAGFLPTFMLFIRTVFLCIAFLSLGLCVSVSGSPLIRLEMGNGVPESTAFHIFTARSVGMLLGGALGSVLFEVYNRQFLLSVSLVWVSAAVTVLPFTVPTALWWTLVSTAALGAGLAFLFTGGNVLCLDLWGRRQGGAALQALHLSFAVGAFVVPLVMQPFFSGLVPPKLHNTTSLSLTTTQMPQGMESVRVVRAVLPRLNEHLRDLSDTGNPDDLSLESIKDITRPKGDVSVSLSSIATTTSANTSTTTNTTTNTTPQGLMGVKVNSSVPQPPPEITDTPPGSIKATAVKPSEKPPTTTTPKPKKKPSYADSSNLAPDEKKKWIKAKKLKTAASPSSPATSRNPQQEGKDHQTVISNTPALSHGASPSGDSASTSKKVTDAFPLPVINTTGAISTSVASTITTTATTASTTIATTATPAPTTTTTTTTTAPATTTAVTPSPTIIHITTTTITTTDFPSTTPATTTTIPATTTIITTTTSPSTPYSTATSTAVPTTTTTTTTTKAPPPATPTITTTTAIPPILHKLPSSVPLETSLGVEVGQDLSLFTSEDVQSEPEVLEEREMVPGEEEEEEEEEEEVSAPSLKPGTFSNATDDKPQFLEHMAQRLGDYGVTRVDLAYICIGIFVVVNALVSVVVLCHHPREARSRQEGGPLATARPARTLLFTVLFSAFMFTAEALQGALHHLLASSGAGTGLDLAWGDEGEGSDGQVVFWGLVCAVRFLCVLASGCLGPRPGRLLAAAMFFGLAGATFMTVGSYGRQDFTWAGVVFLAVGTAPVLPTSLLWMAQHMRVTHRLCALMVVLASFGNTVTHSILAETGDPHSYAYVLLILSLASICLLCGSVCAVYVGQHSPSMGVPVGYQLASQHEEDSLELTPSASVVFTPADASLQEGGEAGQALLID